MTFAYTKAIYANKTKTKPPKTARNPNKCYTTTKKHQTHDTYTDNGINIDIRASHYDKPSDMPQDHISYDLTASSSRDPRLRLKKAQIKNR